MWFAYLNLIPFTQPIPCSDILLGQTYTQEKQSLGIKTKFWIIDISYILAIAYEML